MHVRPFRIKRSFTNCALHVAMTIYYLHSHTTQVTFSSLDDLNFYIY